MTAIASEISGLRWETMTSPGRPAAAIAVHQRERVRVILCEPSALHGSGGGLPHDLAHRVVSGSATQVADRLANSVSSVVVADLMPDGTATVASHAAPSALVVRAGSTYLVRTSSLDSQAPVLRLGPGEALVLASPSALEDPPELLLHLRAGALPHPRPDEIEGILAGLARIRCRGAIAVLVPRAPRFDIASATGENVTLSSYL